jgi:hypothetical protein
VLAFVFLASLAIALFNDATGKKERSPEIFYKFILLIYRNRTIQSPSTQGR